MTIDKLFQLLREKNITPKEIENIQNAIKKYIKLFEDMYPLEDSRKLNDDIYRKDSIKKTKIPFNFNRYREYEIILSRIKTEEHLDRLLTEIEEDMTEEIKIHFEESFFEL
jgi:hypothetical protein